MVTQPPGRSVISTPVAADASVGARSGPTWGPEHRVLPGCPHFHGSVNDLPGTGLAMSATGMKKFTWPIANISVASALAS